MADVDRLRPKLLALAYRMLGSAADAEDAVQDAYLRWQGAHAVGSPEAWLVKVTTRICIDRLRRAKHRESYVGPWLPEPISDRWDGAACDRLELAESLSMAFLVLLETLSPSERAAYLLREVFGYEFEEIGALLDKTPVNVRQLTARARRRLGEKQRRFRPDPGHADDLAGRFYEACRSGDLEAIESLLTEDVAFYGDGGGKAHAAPRPVTGARRVAKLLSVVFRKRRSHCDVRMATVNGQPGVVFSAGGEVVQIITFAPDGGRLGALYTVLNPDKLQKWGADSPSSGVGPG